MGFDRIRSPERNVDVSAVCLPSWFAGRIVVIGVLDAPVMLFAELIVRGVGVGVPAEPELLNKSFALFVVAEALKGLAFLVRNNVGDVLIEPGFISAFQFLPELFLGLELCIVGARALQRIRFILARRTLARSRASL